MKRFTILFAVCAVCALCASCSTINNLQGHYSRQRFLTFGGTAMDLKAFGSIGRKCDLGPAIGFAMVVLSVIDLPFSFAGDIVTLPYTLWVDLMRVSPDDDPPPKEDAVPPEERQDE